MSVEESNRFRVHSLDGHGFAILDLQGQSFDGHTQVVDRFTSQRSADSACRLLNADLAVVEAHGALGCRVTPLYSVEATREQLFASEAFRQLQGQTLFEVQP